MMTACKVTLALAALGFTGAGAGCLSAQKQPDSEAPLRSFPPEQYAKALALIKPQAGEAKWLDIPWEIDVWQARQKAAAAGKPIFFLTGGGKSPLGDC